MGRLLRKLRRGRRGSLEGGSLGALGDAASTISTGIDAVSTAIDVSTDPYLPELLCRAKQLYQINHHQPVQSCQKLPLTFTGGIGLRNAIVPARMYVYAEQNRWAYLVAALAVVGIPLLLGIELGRSTK